MTTNGEEELPEENGDGTDPTGPMVKHLLYTWFEEVPDPTNPTPGAMALRERITGLGERVPDTIRQADLDRGKALDSFYSDEDAEAIEAGTYSGPDAAIVYAKRARTGLSSPETEAAASQPQAALPPADAGDIASQDAPAIGEYIKSNKLTVQQTLALVPDNADDEMIDKFLDAENIATNNDPRAGVVNALEARLTT
jgi:hypothetical protein